MIGRLLPPAGPLRAIAVVQLVDRAGTGIWFTLSALYLTRVVGFTPVQVGAGLSLAATTGLMVGVPAGHLADRVGARAVMIAGQLLAAAAMTALLWSRTWGFFTLTAAVFAFAQGATQVARNGLIGHLTAGGERVRFRAYLRSITNIGMAIGTGIAAVALQLDTAPAYRGVLALNVLSSLVISLLALRVPEHRVAAGATPARLTAALRDGPAVLVMLLSSVLLIHYFVLEIGAPLWVVNNTHAPRWMVPVLLYLNMITCVLLQVAVAKRVVTVAQAVRANAIAGVLLLGGCVVMGLSGSLTSPAAVVVLLLAGGLLVAGELAQAAASFVINYELAPPEALSAYQGLFSTGYTIAGIIAPTLIATLPIGLGLPGWIALGVLMCAAALGLAPAVRWAERTAVRGNPQVTNPR